jgi:hypothetical protein
MINPLLAKFAPLERLAATPVVYLLLWTGLVALSVSFIVLLRTGWGQSRPLGKCALLSLLVHMLLICAAMTVKIVAGDGDEWQAAPIRVHIVDGGDGTATPTLAMVSPPTLFQHVPDTIEQPEAQHEDSVDVAQARNPPTDLTTADRREIPIEPRQPTPVPVDASSTNVAVAPSVTENRVADPVSDPVQQESSSQPPSATANENSNRSEAPAGKAVDASASRAETPAPANNPYGGRTAGNRMRLVEGEGGNIHTEAAVVAALNWLAAAQSPDGHWDAERHGAGVERGTLGKNRNGAGRDADTGITALALLAFLGAGHTHLEGDYQTTVQHGLEFLLRSQAADGSLFGGAGLYAQMYCHSMATFALAEAQAMTGDARLGPGASRAVEFCIRAQHPTDGGWRYEVGNKGDTSQLGWQTMAIASGERAGVSVPLATWTGIDRFLRSVRRGQFGGLASYQQFSPMSTSMTAEALYCRLLLIDKFGGALDERAALEAIRQILAQPPTRSQVNLYYWYYATLALHHRHTVNEQADEAWRDWNSALTTVLVESQIANGANAGSWEPDMEWGGYGGRVYSTALAALCLEVYYRYLPTVERGNPEMVTRPGRVEASR